MAEPKLDIFPDGWGMRIDEADQVTPEEAREIIKGVEEMTEGKTRSIEEISEQLRKKGN